MADWTLNLKGDFGNKSVTWAANTDTLTAALKKEEAALKATNEAFLRGAAAGTLNEKSEQKLIDKAKAHAQAVERLKDSIVVTKAAGDAGTRIGFFAAIEKSGGPIGGLLRNLRAARESLAANPWAAAATGVAVLGAAYVALSAKVLGAARDVALFGLASADSARSTSLLNEAADLAGGTHRQLDAVIGQISDRSTLAKARLGEMARELRTLRFDSRQTQLTVSAMATAESALGSGASSAVRGIAESSRAMRRFTLGARDAYGEYQSLKATGLSKGEVFAALSKNLGKGEAQVKSMLASGRITVRQGLEAIDAALEHKFGGVVKRQALGIESQFAKMKEDFASLFSGAEIEPFLEGLKSVTGMFSQNTASGRAFKQVFSAALTEVGAIAKNVFPMVKDFLLGAATGAIQFYLAVRPSLKAMGILGDSKAGAGLSNSFAAGSAAAKGLAADLLSIVASIDKIVSGAKAVSGALSAITNPFEAGAKSIETGNGYRELTGKEATDMGLNLTAGIARGIEAGSKQPETAIVGLASKLKTAFTTATEQHSPSLVFARYGEQLPAGVSVGVDRGAPEAQASVRNMLGDTMPTTGTTSAGPRNYYDLRGAVFQLKSDSPPSLLAEFADLLKSAADQGASPVPT